MFLVIFLCYHLMLSSEMITSPFFIIPENFSHSLCLAVRNKSVSALLDSDPK
jgi:hypothetical protein